MIINKYKLHFDNDNYLTSFEAVLKGEYDYEGQMSQYPDACEGWTKFENGTFVEDEVKKAEIIAQREEEAKKPTEAQKLEAQLLYTAVCTDTLLESETE